MFMDYSAILSLPHKSALRFLWYFHLRTSQKYPKVSSDSFDGFPTSPTIAQVILFMLVSIEARQRRPNQSDVAMESMQSGDLSNMGSWAPKS
jgi:hypothetical protein